MHFGTADVISVSKCYVTISLEAKQKIWLRPEAKLN